MAALLRLYEHITRAGKPLLRQLLKARVASGKEDPARLPERMGKPSRPRPEGRLIWVHAASVGEAQSALILIEALGKNQPRQHILVTTGTLTSATLMERRLPAYAFHQYMPVDNPGWVTSFLDHWKPDLALWMESELWPNMLRAIKRRGIQAVLINARLSDRSFYRWSFAPSMAQELISGFTAILAQTDADAARFRKLGATNVIVSDNIKYSAASLPADEEALATLKICVGERPVWVYASTHEGEEDLACRVHKALKEKLPDLLTIVVPRHPERREAVAETCFRNGLKYTLRSVNVALPAQDDDIYIADTLGELGLFYTLCPVAMIGRSFSNDGGGGHNPVEAAQLGCAVMTGPHNQFQQQIYDDMKEAGAVAVVKDEVEFAAILQELLTNPRKLEELKSRTESFVARKTHVIDTVVRNLAPVLARLERPHAA